MNHIQILRLRSADAYHQQCEEDESLSAKVLNLIGDVMLSNHIVGFRSFFFGSVFCR
jgi:hypothetical protein